MWGGACVSCSAGGTEEGKECLWLVYSWTTECCLGQDTWQSQCHKPHACEADVLLVHCVTSGHETHLKLCHISAAWAWVPEEVREALCKWTSDTDLLHFFTELFYSSPFLVPFWIREDDWGSDIQTLLLAAYGKSLSTSGTSPKLPAAPHNATPPPSLPACRAGLRSNYIWGDLVKGAASLKPWRLWCWAWLLDTTGLLSSLHFNHMKWPQREQHFHWSTQVVEMITSSPGSHLNKKCTSVMAEAVACLLWR